MIPPWVAIPILVGAFVLIYVIIFTLAWVLA